MQVYLGIKLLQEGLLGGRHHCVQVGLEGFKLFGQKHPEKKKKFKRQNYYVLFLYDSRVTDILTKADITFD